MRTVSQIITFQDQSDVNSWLLKNYDKQIINISVSYDSAFNRKIYLIHFKRVVDLV
jgi:hypothetical protein